MLAQLHGRGNGDPCETDALVGKGKAKGLQRGAIMTATFACLSGLLLGYDIGVSNGSLEPVAFTYGLDDAQQGLFVGILNLAALPGCVIGGFVADWLGRRGATIVGSVTFLIGNTIMMTAPNFPVLIAGRALAGIAVGMTLVIGPLLTSESAPKRLRGLLTTNLEFSFNIGILLGFGSGWFFRDLPETTSWRWMVGVCMWVPVTSIIAMMFFVSESPSWLAMKGRFREAEDSCRNLFDHKEAEEVMASLAPNAKTGKKQFGWMEMLTSPHTRWLIVLGGGVAFFSQATGIETVMYYSSVILEDGGLERDEALKWVVVMGLVKVAAIVPAGQLVDSLGRKPLLIMSSLGMALSMLGLGRAFQFESGFQEKVLPLLTFVISFSAGFGPIVFTVNAEIFPTACRSKGVTLGMCIARVTSALVALSFLSLESVLGTSGAFYFYAYLGGLATLFVFFILPETKGTNPDGDDEMMCHM